VNSIFGKPSQVLVGFALTGLIITAAICAYFSVCDYTKPISRSDAIIGIFFMVLCPPSLLAVLYTDCEIGTEAGVVAFSIIGLLNSGLYAVIGVLIGIFWIFGQRDGNQH
jgi:hypothetical protein